MPASYTPGTCFTSPAEFITVEQYAADRSLHNKTDRQPRWLPVRFTFL